MIMQDDCIPVPGWEEPAAQARELLPDALICYSVQGSLHSTARNEFWRAQARGPSLVQIQPHNWVSCLALGWTPALAQTALLWDETQNRLRPNFTSDDGRVYYFHRASECEVWMTVPCLVDHPDDVPSVTGGVGKGRAKRRPLALYEESSEPFTWLVNTLY